MIKIITVLGARPQFIKASALSKLIKKDKRIKEIIIHTGQHYDEDMSKIFFKELGIPKPKYNLNIKSKFHGEMIGKMISSIEKLLIYEKPNYVIVYGDTNSTLAGALAAKKLHIPVIHIEAGLRGFNQNMPEEINRVLTDHCSSILFVPSKLAKKNLKKEGFSNKKIFNVGDIMYEVYLNLNNNLINNKDNFDILVTIHRAENTNFKKKLINIIFNLNELSKKFKIIFPIHPRTKNILKKYNILNLLDNKITITKPLAYHQSISILKNSKLLITDSGGMQKESFFSKVQALTIRDETEWPETINAGWNRLIKPKSKLIYLNAIKYMNKKGKNTSPYGFGNTSKLILKHIKKISYENKI